MEPRRRNEFYDALEMNDGALEQRAGCLARAREQRREQQDVFCNLVSRLFSLPP